jgi:hypothetical protein
MGIKNQEAVLGCRKKLGLTASEYLFLWYLAFRGNDEERDNAERGEAWPGQTTIAADLGIEKKYIPKIVKRLGEIGILGCAGDYKDRTSLTYFIHYDKIAELMGVNPTPPESPQGLKEPLGGVNPTPVEGLKEPLVGVGLTPGGRSENPRTGIELELEKKNINGNKQKQRSSVSSICSFETTGETPVPPDEQQKLEWAKGLTPYPCWIGWKKFTDNPKSFRKACLESETFNNQFRDRMKKPAKGEKGYKNPAHHSGTSNFLSELNHCKNCYGMVRETLVEGRCADCVGKQTPPVPPSPSDIAQRTCSHCKSVGKEFLRHGYCRECIHHHPDRELHWYYCKCERCVAYHSANPRVKAAPAPRVKQLMFEEDPL